MGGILIDIDSEGTDLSSGTDTSSTSDTGSDASEEQDGKQPGEKPSDKPGKGKGKSKGDKQGDGSGEQQGQGQQQEKGEGEQSQDQGDSGGAPDTSVPQESEIIKIIRHITKKEFNAGTGNLGWLTCVIPRKVINACDFIQRNLTGPEGTMVAGKDLIFLDRQTAKALLLFLRDADYITDAGINISKLLFHLFYKNKIIWSERTNIQNPFYHFYFISVIPESCAVEVKTIIYMGFADKKTRSLLTLVKMLCDRTNKEILFDGEVAEQNFQKIENKVLDLFSTINQYFWKPEEYIKMVQRPQRSVFMLDRMNTFLNMLKMTM